VTATPDAAPPKDPQRGLRGIMAATLFLEAIAVGLALPVVAKLGGGISSLAGWLITALVLAMLAAAFLQRRPWGLGLALALQVAMIACWPLVPTLGVLGVVFALVWVYLLWLRRTVAQRLSSGEE
jgi:Protein of unknown function (DUF4233)